mgnify:CR=1 FL=1
MKEEREVFAGRLADAMQAAGYKPRPPVLFRLFNSRYRGQSVSFQSVSRWLGGRAIPGQDKLQVVATLLGVEPHALRFGNGSANRVAESRESWFAANLEQADRAAINTYLSMPSSHRKPVRELIALIAKLER